MLIHVHRTCAAGIGIPAGGIVPHRSSAGCKPDVECVKEDAIRIVRIDRDSLVVPILWIIAGTTLTVSERAALGTLHITPARAAICGSPGAKLAASAPPQPPLLFASNGLPLCVNIIRVAWRDSNLNATELVAGRGIDKRAAGAGIHRRACRVRAAGDLIAEHEPIGVAGD